MCHRADTFLAPPGHIHALALAWFDGRGTWCTRSVAAEAKRSHRALCALPTLGGAMRAAGAHAFVGGFGARSRRDKGQRASYARRSGGKCREVSHRAVSASCGIVQREAAGTAWHTAKRAIASQAHPVAGIARTCDAAARRGGAAGTRSASIHRVTSKMLLRRGIQGIVRPCWA
jgi:hypothetical protein